MTTTEVICTVPEEERPPQLNGPYCSYRSRRNCQGNLVGLRVKQRTRLRGKEIVTETFRYLLCEHHNRVAR